MVRLVLKKWSAALLCALLAVSFTACGGGPGADKNASKSGSASAQSAQSGGAGDESGGVSGDTASGASDAGGASGAGQSNQTGGGSTSSKKGGATSSMKSLTGAQLDMKGYVFVIGTAYYSNFLNKEGVLDPNNPLIKTIADIERKFNCKIQFKRFNDVSGAGTQIINAVRAGDKICDLAHVQFSRARFVAVASAAHDIAALPGIALDKNFHQAMTFAHTFNKKTFAVNWGFENNVQGLFFNKDVIKKYAPQYDIYKLYKEGKWTQSLFETVLRATTKDTNGDNKFDIVGLTGGTAAMALTMLADVGGTTMKNGNKVSFAIASANAVKGLTFNKRLYDDGLWNYPNDTFNAGGAAFTSGPSWKYKNYADVDFGFVPWPKGDLNKYASCIADGAAWCVPKTVKQRGYAAVVLNELAASNAQLITDGLALYEDAGWDTDGLAVLKWMQSNYVVDMTTGPDITEFDKVIRDAVFVKNTQPAAAMESIRSASQQRYDDYYRQYLTIK